MWVFPDNTPKWPVFDVWEKQKWLVGYGQPSRDYPLVNYYTTSHHGAFLFQGLSPFFWVMTLVIPGGFLQVLAVCHIIVTEGLHFEWKYITYAVRHVCFGSRDILWMLFAQVFPPRERPKKHVVLVSSLLHLLRIQATGAGGRSYMGCYCYAMSHLNATDLCSSQQWLRLRDREAPYRTTWVAVCISPRPVCISPSCHVCMLN